jgi:hypothetical protein
MNNKTKVKDLKFKMKFYLSRKERKTKSKGKPKKLDQLSLNARQKLTDSFEGNEIPRQGIGQFYTGMRVKTI